MIASEPTVWSYTTYDGWWCWTCEGMGCAEGGTEDCRCCGGGGEHEDVLPPPCAPRAALTGLDLRWWGIAPPVGEEARPR